MEGGRGEFSGCDIRRKEQQLVSTFFSLRYSTDLIPPPAGLVAEQCSHSLLLESAGLDSGVLCLHLGLLQLPWCFKGHLPKPTGDSIGSPVYSLTGVFAGTPI